MKLSISFLFLFIALFTTIAGEKDTIDRKLYSGKVAQFGAERFPSKGKLLSLIGQSFIGTPYVAHTLEGVNPERLIVNLRELDCTTFLETVSALTLTISSRDTSYRNFQKYLTLLRYREGKLNLYPSRLHYFSDWIYDNVKKGIIHVVSDATNGEVIRFPVNYMSSHSDAYLHLKNERAYIGAIAEQEKLIGQRDYYYWPKQKVAANDNLIKDGDLIAITSSVEGLDINHVGIAVRKGKGPARFLHASLNDKKVVLTDSSLSNYLASVKRHTGIIVFRLTDLKDNTSQ